MGQITVYAAVANAAAKMPVGRDRDLLEKACIALDFRGPSESALAALGATILEFEDDDSTRQIGAICPHCKREPCAAAAQMVQFGMFPVLQITCSGCRKILAYSIVPPVPVEKPQEAYPSGIVLPPR
jgi:hypothetical protein